jgi:hypothetical protein
MYEVKEPVWQFIDHWQTLIAGLLALAAGVIAVVATMKSANREIAAAQEQTKAAQRQTAVMREIERRRIAREGYAFHTMLEAAMAGVIEDVEAARKLLPNLRRDPYAVRQRLKREGFAELRGAFLSLGGSLTEPFLRLDKEIEDLSDLRTEPQLKLDSIEHQATTLRDEAARGMKLCRDELANELVNLEP